MSGRNETIIRRKELIALLAEMRSLVKSAGEDLNDYSMSLFDALWKAEAEIAKAPLPPETLQDIVDQPA